MTWIRSENGELLNLEHAERIFIIDLDEEEGVPPGTSAIVADFPSSDEFDYIYTDSHAVCEQVFYTLMSKLPIIKGVVP